MVLRAGFKLQSNHSTYIEAFLLLLSVYCLLFGPSSLNNKKKTVKRIKDESPI